MFGLLLQQFDVQLHLRRQLGTSRAGRSDDLRESEAVAAAAPPPPSVRFRGTSVPGARRLGFALYLAADKFHHFVVGQLFSRYFPGDVSFSDQPIK